VTWGLTALALHSRCTVAFDTSIALAIVRTDHRVRFFGGRVAPTMIFSRICGAIRGLRPRPFASLRPAMPDFSKRCSHCTTTDWRTPTFRAVSLGLTQPISSVEDNPSSPVIPMRSRRAIYDGVQGAPLLGANAQSSNRPCHGLALYSNKFIISSQLRDTTLARLAELFAYTRYIEAGFEHFRLNLKRPREMIGCLAQAPLCRQCISSIVLCFGHLRVPSHSLSTVCDGFISAVHLHQDVSKIVMRSGIGPYFHSLSVMSERFVELRLPRTDHTQTKMSLRLIREDSQHFLKVRLRFIKPSSIGEDAA